MTDTYESLGKMIAKQQGLPNLRMIAVPHPLAGVPEADVDRMAIRAGADTLALLKAAHASVERV